MRYFGSASKHRRKTNCHPFSELEDIITLLEPENKTHSCIIMIYSLSWQTHVKRLTELSLVWLSVLRQLNELFGEHVGTVAQDVALEFCVCIG